MTVLHELAENDEVDHFDADTIFDDVEVSQRDQSISDQDIDNLLGPMPIRRGITFQNNSSSVETSNEANDTRYKYKQKKGLFSQFCHNVIQARTWHALLDSIGRNESRENIAPIGNMILVCPKCYHRVGFGIVGPHWVGPLCCLSLLSIATIYYSRRAYHTIGLVSSIICFIFYIVGLISLSCTSCFDPGIVRSIPSGGEMRSHMYVGVPMTEIEAMNASRGWRFCEFCNIYQPPGAVHCTDCNVCIEGYDHHCPWVGTCIGKRNFSSFVVFNLTWLFYLIYCIVWVTCFGHSLSTINHHHA